MLGTLIAIFGILLTIFFVIGIHELGHFLVARWMGVKVLLFSLGFGKPLYRWHDKKGTEYILAAIPLGGYVKMLDEREMDVPAQERSLAFNVQPYYKKFAIVAAGPFANLLFALLLYWIIFMVGFVGMIPLIGKIQPNSIAAQAGMKPNQEIIKVDNEPTLSWIGVMVHLLMRAGDRDSLNITTQDFNTQRQHTYMLALNQWRLNQLKPDPLESLGIAPFQPHVPNVIGGIKENSPAASVLQLQDKIIAINGTPTPTWIEVARQIDKHPDATLQLTVERNKKIIKVSVKTGYERSFFKKHGFLGVMPAFKWPTKMLRTHQYEPLQALVHAWGELKVFSLLNFIVIGKLLTGKVSLASLGGPITIFQSAGVAIHQGILPFLSFLAFLSIAVGLINILPIPGLDGGHLLFQTIEAVMRKPIPINIQILAYRFGLIVLFLLLTQAIVNDIMRL